MPSTTIGPVLKLRNPDDFVAGPRTVPDPAHTRVTVTEWPELTKQTEDRLVADIKQAHAEALFRRRHRLRTDLVAVLNTAGIQTQYTAVGPLHVRYPPDEHLVWITTRPPEVDDFRSLYAADEARTKPSRESRGVIVGPLAAQEPDRKRRLSWLETVSGCPSFDEGDLPAFVRRVKDQLCCKAWCSAASAVAR